MRTIVTLNSLIIITTQPLITHDCSKYKTQRRLKNVHMFILKLPQDVLKACKSKSAYKSFSFKIKRFCMSLFQL